MYRDGHRQDLHRTVLLVVVTHGYRDFLYNWICHAERLGFKYLVVALDREIQAHAEKHGVKHCISYDWDVAAGFSIGDDVTWVSRSARNRTISAVRETGVEVAK